MWTIVHTDDGVIERRNRNIQTIKMKKLLLLLTMFISLVVIAKPLPQNKHVAFKTREVPTVDVWYETSERRVDITVRRAFAYTTCEYTTVQVRLYTSFKYGWPRQTYWTWLWCSCSVTIPAGSDTGYFSFYLKDGEQIDVNQYMVDPLQYCY